MNAIIISIGDELTAGLTVNTNAAWLGRQLSALGINCRRQLTVGDDQAAIAMAVRQSIGQCDILLLTGGLGPTEDDLTRDGLAEALAEPLVQDDAALADLEAFFQRIQRTMVDNNRRQAMRPASARCVANSCGTAPGIIARRDQTDIFAMPGVPKEMQEMFTQSFLPLLRVAAGDVVRRISNLNICGAGESWIGAQIADLMRRGANPAVGTTVHDGIVSIRIYATGKPAEVAAMIAEQTKSVRQRLGTLIFSQDDVTLDEVVAARLRDRHETIATAESCTGGMVAALLTNIPGSSNYFLRGWVTYSNAGKIADLGIASELLQRHGAVSEQVAGAMAVQARKKAGANWGIGITGIAGPDGGTADKPVGLVYIGLAGPNDAAAVYVRPYRFSGDRHSVRRRSSQMALMLLFLKLNNQNPDNVLPH
ncbi:MAG: competence/damage-inducible protein A [Phycisphaerae bacterium]